ncbi:HET-domain-containing protein [Mollisia scopiformis]|uniref:HET-domain-containing protein n=1 Tax=Mollisia scopiformis TaxID=149040 RepID=A0A194XL69_MOLSC|nr:HET-domain-containing protein [Mollisia scopiformis]KUJ20839.1 HET-domain-containing protein [Mollisia scopiformis]
MRLLQSNSDGSLTPTEFFEDDIPEYAILSHRWGPEEVTFRDLIDGTSKAKAGYNKIQFCGEQARRDGLEYFWVDTCCIDKSSSAELSEAINSMFRWYQKAARCYVYLSDVSIRKGKASDTSAECTWESAFRASKWFTRGWTLQELLAPRSVEFFSREGNRLGDKATLEQQINEITGIPITALREQHLSQFGIDERFLWAKSRQTTRGEDKTYSLLGIFDVHMPLIYGEGEAKAFQRLRETIDKPSYTLVSSSSSKKDLLRQLPNADKAPYNAYDRQDEPACLPNTRVDLLQEIYDWIDGKDGQDERCIFWLSGLAGTGKSTISRTVARRCSEQKRLGASFFFSKGDGDVSHAGKFFTSLAQQLAKSIPSLQRQICDAIVKQSDVANLSLLDQWRQFVLGPLSRLEERQQSYVLVIDALDECKDDNDVRTILKFLAEARSLETVRLRVFLTSRPEIPIRHGIRDIPQAEHQDFVLHDIQPSIIDHDISLFLEDNLGRIRQEWTLESNWPGEEALRQLVLYACGLFIWASTTCRFIREGKRFARQRLDVILQGSSSAVTVPEKHLNDIYLFVLKHSISSDYSDEEKKEACDMLKHILGSTIVLLSPLSTSALKRLLQVSKEDVDSTFNDLHSILDIPNDPVRQLRLHHPSFRDFLLSKDRCGDFWVDEKEAHQRLATNCIQLMSQALKKDICDIHAPGTRTSQVESSHLQECTPPEVQYACLYWVQHLQRSGSQASDGEEVHQFLQAHLLH